MIIKSKLLKREYLVDKYLKSNNHVYENNKNEYIKYLNMIEEEFYSHDFKKDNRYVCIGRDRILIDEIKDKLKNHSNDGNISPLIVCITDLTELMYNPNFLTIKDYDLLKNYSDIYNGKSKSECAKIYNEYINSKIVSLNERDYIMYAINMIKDELDNYDDNLNYIK